VIVADYTLDPRAQARPDIQSALSIDQARRNQIEALQAESVAAQIAAQLPQDERKAAQLLQSGYALSQKLSWQVVAEEYLLPGLERAWEARRR
jgi:hypothetical protein